MNQRKQRKKQDNRHSGLVFTYPFIDMDHRKSIYFQNKLSWEIIMEEFDIHTLLGGDAETITLKGGGDLEDSEEAEDTDYEAIDRAEEEIENRYNSIQDVFDDFLQHPTDELLIPLALDGKVDFAPLELVPTLRKITFSKPGRVTELAHLPEQLEELVCSQQHLQDLGTLPASLKYLIVHENKLKALDLESTPLLVKLNISDNDMESLIHLPIPLKELYCDYNRLELLDLSGIELDILHICHNQQRITIRGLFVEKLKEYKTENTTVFQTKDETTDKKVGSTDKKTDDKKTEGPSVKEQMDEYYKIKHNYLVSIQKKTPELYRCVICNKPGGMIFEIRDKKLLGRCGHATEPCRFSMEIDKGDYVHLQSFRSQVHTQYNQIQQDIIDLGYNLRHGYLKDAKEMDVKLRELNAIEKKHHWVNTWWTDEKKETKQQETIIQLKNRAEHAMKIIQEEYKGRYKKNPNSKVLNEIVKQQLNEYNPCMIQLYRYQYALAFDLAHDLNTQPDPDILGLYDSQYFLREVDLDNI